MPCHVGLSPIHKRAVAVEHKSAPEDYGIRDIANQEQKGSTICVSLHLYLSKPISYIDRTKEHQSHIFKYNSIRLLK